MRIILAFIAALGYLVFPAVVVLAWPYLFGIAKAIVVLIAIWSFFRYDTFIEGYFEPCQRSDS